MPESIRLEIAGSQTSDTDESDEKEEEGTKWESELESSDTSSDTQDPHIQSASDEDQAATEVCTASFAAPSYWTPARDRQLQRLPEERDRRLRDQGFTDFWKAVWTVTRLGGLAGQRTAAAPRIRASG